MGHDVILSYARATSRTYAEALHRELGGTDGLAFLDTTNIEAGEPIPPTLVDALLEAKVVVIFADEAYFKSWYCQWEYRAALAPFLALEPGASEEAKRAALTPIVIALPPEGSPRFELDRLPPQLRMTHWARADETWRLAEMVREQLRVAASGLRTRIDAAGGFNARTRAFALEEASLPPPVSLAGFRPLHPLQRPPSLGASFVGRAEELWRIHFTLAALRGDAVGATLTGGALEGGGGFGKTRLALEYIHRLGPRYYRGGIFWVDADVSDDRLEEQFHGILRELKPGEIPDLATFRELRRNAAEEVARGLHEASGRGPILYVVDNVPEPGAGKTRRPIETWCPALGKVALLVTSRLKLLKADNLKPLTVDVLAPEAAVALLSEGIRSDLDASSWRRIAGWVGYLPLALELLNRAMESGGVTPRELVAKVEQGPVQELDRQMEALREQVTPGSLRGVTEALSLSFERLSEPARFAALLLAWLAPEPIPLALLEALGPKVDSAAVRTALVSRHFIRAAEGAPVPMFGGMHRVLADFLRSRSADPAEELTPPCVALGDVMTQSACRDTEEWPLMNACLPHAETILAHRKRLNVKAGAEDEVDLGKSLQIFFLAKGLAARARSLGESIVQRASESLGEEHPDALAAMTNLAVSLCEQGALSEARELQSRVLESSERHWGAEDMVTLNAKHSLARILDAQGDSASAQAILEEILEPMRRQLGPEHENVLSTLNNLGHVLSVQGKEEEARVLQEQVVEARRRVLGSNHRETLTALNNLATTLKDLGDTAGARRIHEEVLESRLRALGEDHPSTLNSMNNLAIVLGAEGEVDKAMALTERAMTVLLRTQGPEHGSTLAAMHEHANLLRDQRRYAEAREIMERVIKSLGKVLGKEHPKTLTAMGNLVGTLLMERNFQRARGIQKRILATQLRIHGNEHPSTTIAAWNYFSIQHELRNHHEAKKVLSAHLEWLMKRAPETLSADQRTIREHVMNLVGRPPRR